MFRKLVLAGTAAGTLMGGPAVAQTEGQRIVIERSPSARQEGYVRVQSSINFFVPGPTGDGEEAAALRERAKRIVYEMAAKECDVLRDVLAKECRLETVTSNLHRQAAQVAEGYNVQGSASLQITLK
jgi:hypothetical protein